MSTTTALAYRLTAATGLHKGDRAYQQDQVEILMHARVKGCALAIVADGMGGKSGGRKAADQVLLTGRQVFERYVPQQDDPQELLQQPSAVIVEVGNACHVDPHGPDRALRRNRRGHHQPLQIVRAIRGPVTGRRQFETVAVHRCGKQRIRTHTTPRPACPGRLSVTRRRPRQFRACAGTLRKTAFPSHT